jgi:hypothetical protein
MLLAGACLVGAIVWMSVGTDVAALVRGAGWWSLVVLAFPALMGVLAWRFGDEYVG